MNKYLLVNGVPNSIRLGGWWLTCDSAATSDGSVDQKSTKPTFTTKKLPVPMAVLLILVLLADWLFWAQSPGISVAVFAMILSVSILAVRRGGTTRREWIFALGFEVICNLPVVEQLQPMSLLFTSIGIAALVVWVNYGRIVEWWQALWAMIRVSSVGAVLLPIHLVDEIRGVQSKAGLRQHLQSLLLPLGVGLVFVLLLTSANPILERFLDQLARLEFLTTEQMLRVIFWFFVASFVWPYLNLNQKWLGPVAKAPGFRSVPIPGLDSLVNIESVRNSLVLFNILFLVQTVMDIGVLTGGMSLPEGMTYARYAHRGAYPLVATALLAGGFAIATHRMIADSGFLRNLLFLWLGQNLFLVITAAFRLSLYIETYGLTLSSPISMGHF